MNDETKNKLDEFIELFLNQKVVVQYLNLKKEIEHSQTISSLTKELKQAQKDMALAIGNKDEHELKKQRYLELKKNLDTDPLMVNFEFVKNEMHELLLELTNALK